jgi:imidazole glycerol-phosphate synthase subunit HisH
MMMVERSSLVQDGDREEQVAIIDYGICNVGSVRNILRRSGVLATCIDDPAELAHYGRMILPGIGFFRTGMQNLERGGWIEPIQHFALEQRKPVLGICLGMQLLARHSEEGDYAGLGLLDMRVQAFDKQRLGAGLPVPHMGWSPVDAEEHPLSRTSGLQPQRFYFVHGLHVVAEPGAVDPIFWCNYGYPFLAACGRDNIMGVQFHPEKSHAFGAELLSNFARM